MGVALTEKVDNAASVFVDLRKVNGFRSIFACALKSLAHDAAPSGTKLSFPRSSVLVKKNS